MSKLRRSATINIHTGLRKFLKEYCTKLDPKKKISALDWLDSDDTARNSDEIKVINNRNSLEDDCEDGTSDEEEASEVTVSDWPDSEEEVEEENCDFEDFSATDTEEGDDEDVSDSEGEDELFDHFDVNTPIRRKSNDDVLSPVRRGHEVKLSYSVSLCEPR